MSDDQRPQINKWWVFGLLMAVAIALNVSLYIKVALYGP